MAERIVVLFSVSTLLTPAHTYTPFSPPLPSDLYVLVMGWHSVFANVLLFFHNRCRYLIHFLFAGTQTHCEYHCRHPCLDILEPQENDVLIFLCGRESETVRRGGL